MAVKFEGQSNPLDEVVSKSSRIAKIQSNMVKQPSLSCSSLSKQNLSSQIASSSEKVEEHKKEHHSGLHHL